MSRRAVSYEPEQHRSPCGVDVGESRIIHGLKGVLKVGEKFLDENTGHLTMPSFDQEDPDDVQRVFRLCLIYLFPLIYVVILCLDLVLLLVVQILWGTMTQDFMCTTPIASQFVGLRAFVIVFHAYLLLQNLAVMDSEGHLHFLRFVHRLRAPALKEKLPTAL